MRTTRLLTTTGTTKGIEMGKVEYLDSAEVFIVKPDQTELVLPCINPLMGQVTVQLRPVLTVFRMPDGAINLAWRTDKAGLAQFPQCEEAE